MTKVFKNYLKYPITISLFIHGIVFVAFSLILINSEEVPTNKPPIHIKKIIYEKKKAAPAGEKSSPNSVKTYKPTATARSLQKRKATPRAQPKPLPRTPKALGKYVPTQRAPEYPNRFQKPDLQPITPASSVPLFSKPATYVTTGLISKPRPTKTVQPKFFSDLLSVTTREPMRMASSVERFLPKPFGKPMQVASIPKSFINVSSSEKSENSLDDISDKGAPNKNHGIPNSNGDDLNALRKGYSSKVWTKIANAKFYPRIARRRGVEGKPVVEFELRSDGQLLSYFIALSSSSKILDNAAIEAVKNANPFPGIPKPLNLKSIRFKLPISFKLNEP